MASQQDMFREDSDHGNISPRMVASLKPTDVKKEYKYQWVILFHWNVDEENPFFMLKLSNFKDTDIKPEWIKRNLSVDSRIKQLKNLSPFPGGTYSLFAKVEEGVSTKDRTEMVKKLNSKFQEISTMPGSDIGMCLRLVAEFSPYR